MSSPSPMQITTSNISLRDLMAAMAMQTYLSLPDAYNWSKRDLAKASYALADAMIEYSNSPKDQA